MPLTRMTVRLATGASVTVMKRVVGIQYRLKGKQYDGDFIVLDLVTNSAYVAYGVIGDLKMATR